MVEDGQIPEASGPSKPAVVDIRDQYAYLRPQRAVWLVIMASTALHFGLVGLLVMGGLRTEGFGSLREKAIITRLLKKGQERPKNQLPHKDVRPTPPPSAPAPAPAVQPTTGAKPAAPKAPSRVDYSSQMKSAMSDLREEAKKTDYEQNGHPEGVDEGDSLVAEKGDLYLTEVYKSVKAKYSVPELITERERMFLNATVVITLDGRGNIRELSFEKHSGNDLFDSAIENAVRRAAPFPAPPPELVDKYASVGIGLNFRANKM